jgi:hypothetical protein
MMLTSLSWVRVVTRGPPNRTWEAWLKELSSMPLVRH